MKTAKHWIDSLNLLPHPEGGHYRETYRSAHSTAIYFLLEGNQVSAFHRIKSDELWHFHDGGSLTLTLLHADGRREDVPIGPDHPQAVVPGGTWFGARLDNRDSYALVGCTVAPAFEFKDFEMGDRSKLVSLFPQHRAIIEALTTDGHG
jgi:predicted cupin superfamily sugar epimerase